MKKAKFENLVRSCNSFLIKNNLQNDLIKVEYYNEDIEELFPRLLPIIQKYPSLVYLDQNGVKFLNDNFLLPLTGCKQTDFIYFVSSQHVKRFGQLKEFKDYLKVDVEVLKKVDNSKVHQTLTELIRDRLPKDSGCNLYPFSLKKQNNYNIYGIIFGATHLLAVDKFLKIAWNANGINGNANFDIEDEENPQVVMDFFGEGKMIKKVDKFKQDLRRKVLNGEIITNKDVLSFCYTQGHLSQHGTDCIREMKKKNEIYYDGQPLISYNSIHKDNRLKQYEILING